MGEPGVCLTGDKDMAVEESIPFSSSSVSFSSSSSSKLVSYSDRNSLSRSAAALYVGGVVRHIRLAQVMPEGILFTRLGLRVADFLEGIEELGLLFLDFLTIVKSLVEVNQANI